MKNFLINCLILLGGMTAGLVIALILTNAEAAPAPTESVTSSEVSREEVSEKDDKIETPESTNINSGLVEKVDEFSFIPMSKDLRNFVKKTAEFYGFEEKLIYQIIYNESRYRPDADNGLCVGLMQVNKNYVKHYLTLEDGYDFKTDLTSDIKDPRVNIVLGCRILKDWSRMTNNSDVYDLLGYYNMGWNYSKRGSNGYNEKVLKTDLSTIDFSNYEIIE